MADDETKGHKEGKAEATLVAEIQEVEEAAVEQAVQAKESAEAADGGR